MALTLWSARYDDYQLRQVAGAAARRDQGSARRLRGHDHRRPAAPGDASSSTRRGSRPTASTRSRSPARIQARERAAARPPAVVGGNTRQHDRGRRAAGERRRRCGDVVVAAPRRTRRCSLRDVAAVRDGDAEPSTYVTFHSRDGRRAPGGHARGREAQGHERRSTSRAASSRSSSAARHAAARATCTSRVTRNYGETAAREVERAALAHVPRGALGVGADLARARPARGRRRARRDPGDARAHAVRLLPLRLHAQPHHALRAHLLDRHPRGRRDRRRGEHRAARAPAPATTARRSPRSRVRAVDEVGNPTILATLTVVAAILPMAFVGGLMGPYMRPIPVGASAAMVFSLRRGVRRHAVGGRAAAAHAGARSHEHEREDRLTRALPPRDGPAHHAAARCGWRSSVGVAVLLLVAMALVPLGLVTVKMLPFDNKSEFQVDRRHARGHAARADRARGSALAARRSRSRRSPTCRPTSGTAAPYNFNGLVRHYFLRRGAAPRRPPGESRAARTSGAEQSHAIAKRVRDALLPIARRFGATHPGRRGAARAAGAADAGGRGLRPRPRAPRRARAARCSSIFERRPASWTSTGTSRSRSRSGALEVDSEKAAAAGLYAGGGRGGRADGGRRRDRRAAARRAGARGRADRAAAAARAARIARRDCRRVRLVGTRAGRRRRAHARRCARSRRRASTTRTCCR